MSDLATLKSNIATDLHRTDLTTRIATAVTDAIALYRSHRFEVNEQQATFSTVAAQESYTTSTIPDDIGQVDSVRLTVNGRRVLLDPLNFTELQRLSSTTDATGQPDCFAWYAQQLFFYPIPDAAYTVLVSYQQRKDAPSGDSDSSTIWTNQCEALIRACAKKLIARDYMRDPELTQSCQAAENEALAALRLESTQLQDDGAGMTPGW